MRTFFSTPARPQTVALALSLLIASPGGAQQPGDQATAPIAATVEQTVPLAFLPISASDQGDGYAQAHATLSYRFMICATDIVMGYRFDPASIVSSGVYWFNGNRIETAPKLVNPTIRISGSITAGSDLLVSISDVTVPVSSQPLSCSSSPYRIGALSDYLGPKATAEQARHLIESLSFRPAPLKTALLNDTLRAPAQQAAATPEPAPQPNPAMANYLAELQRSQQQTADFQAKRLEYESELQAARDARARYEAQYGPKPSKPPKIKKHRQKRDADQMAADKAPAQ